MSVHGAGEVCKDTKESRECGHLGRNNLKPFPFPRFLVSLRPHNSLNYKQ